LRQLAVLIITMTGLLMYCIREMDTVGC